VFSVFTTFYEKNRGIDFACQALLFAGAPVKEMKKPKVAGLAEAYWLIQLYWVRILKGGRPVFCKCWRLIELQNVSPKL
jgi:hypothetical protein